MNNFFRSRSIQAALLSVVGTLIVACFVFILNQLPSVITLYKANLTTQINDPVRRLEPLETGIYIGDLPDGVYGFAHINSIIYEIQKAKPHWKSLKVSNKKGVFDFELQKHDGNHYIVGFVGAETFAKVDDATEKDVLEVSLFPSPWDTEINGVKIPFDEIKTIDIRPINATDKTVIYIFDMKVSAVSKVISTHKK